MKKMLMLLVMVLLLISLSFSQGKKLRVVAEKADVYLEPYTNSAIIETFEKGAVLNFYGSGERNGRYNVYFKSEIRAAMLSGFIKASFVELIVEGPKIAKEESKLIANKEKTVEVQEILKKEEEKSSIKEEAKKIAEIKETKKPAVSEQPTAPMTKSRSKAAKRSSIRFGYNAGFLKESKPISWSEEIYYEDASYNINYGAKKGNSFNFGVGYKFINSVGIELGLDISSRNLNANYSASIPHPLKFDSPREAENTGSYKLSENAAFLNLAYSIPIGNLGIDLYAGPAYFFTSAELISAIENSDSYPYDSVTISAQNEKISQNKFGFNVGSRLGYYFSSGFGIFFNAQYFSSKADFKPKSGIPALSLSLGGFKVGVGLEISF